ncbi:phospholipase A2 inhibitor beta-like isoform X2 [Battus philenor]|uniref:phospholipase A2 inhibitor beta-like isoform X2 n=1 Tax=Battus philenor TaxID=42288 RepID=UPI0035CF7F74
MRVAVLVLAVLAALAQAHALSLCDGGPCACRYHDNLHEDFIRQYIDCSYRKNVFDANYTLPSKAYSLDLSSNGLKILRAGELSPSHGLEELVLKNNLLVEIEANALMFPELRKLDLSNNQLESVDSAVWKSIRKLEYLNLANNRFVTFSQLAFHPLSQLHEVILDNNELGASLLDTNLFDRDGYGLTNKIKKMSIRGIALNAVPDNFFIDAYDLRELVISNNNLTDLFEIPFTLEQLDVSDNPIQEVSGEDFYDVTALRVLKLNNLAIREVSPFTFASLHSLTKLEMERNLNLTEFNALAFGQEVLDDPDDFLLEELSLKSSRLRTLDQKLEVPFGRLTRLDLQGNPWHCDCRITWLKKFQISPHDYEHLRCQTPRTLFNSKLFEVEAAALRCGGGGGRGGAALGLLAFGMLFAATALWLFWYLPSCQARGKLVTSVPQLRLPSGQL